MRIIRLEAENIKRLKAVDITPEGDLVVIGGDNGQGKTSVLDAIWVALAGPSKDRNPEMLRQGAESGHVTLDLGELIVHRTWKGDTTTLKVTTPDGAAFSGPQRKLDELLGTLSFDPLAFTRMAPKAQVKTLLDLLELPFDPEEIREHRKAAYDERTAVNRLAESLKGALAQADLDSLPTEPIDVDGTRAELKELQAQAAALRTMEGEYAESVRKHEHARQQVAEAKKAYDYAQMLLASWEDTTTEAQMRLSTFSFDAELGERLESALDSAARHNALYERRSALESTKSNYETTLAQSAVLSEQIAFFDEMLAQGLKDATLPIDGLAFGDDGVTYNGIPFVQCSGAEQLRVSAAMAMALNPTIRVMRIEDGSLLDASNMEVLAEMATENDFQIWIERVGHGSEIEIVDGTVLGWEPVSDESEDEPF